MQKIRSQLRNSNICVEAEKPAGSRVLLAQHPRPSRFSGHDWRYDKINGRIEELNSTGQQDKNTKQIRNGRTM